ncbi:hypothetical protein EHQ64_06440 [Leptospira sarikeiensis]|uniref:Uncharacterized protein n=2 Tax=Leptospira sarikeiensis TaxID=2484943 RepID=A0A4R9KAN4_9LEPT|nr:hypothetical protein EHQ64_06440 [Leptospira sarikeiensis]
MGGLDSIGTKEMSTMYCVRESGSYFSVEAPILSLKGINLTPICICPSCGTESRTPWVKSRGRLRDWAAFLEEVRDITCSNDSCSSKFSQKYILDYPKEVGTLNKSNLLKLMISWFEEYSGRSISFEEEEDSESLKWDPFFLSVPNWADHISTHLFANIMRYTPPRDLEGVLLGRRGMPLFGGFKSSKSDPDSSFA